MKNLRMFVALTVIVSMLTACSSKTFWTTLGLAGAATAGVAAVIYIRGDLEADIDDKVSDIYDASLTTVRERDYQVTEKEENASDALIKAKMPQTDGKEKPLTIKIKAGDEGKTHISIRAGMVGEEELSREILDDILKKL